GGGNDSNSASAPAGYPASYTSQQASIQQRAASRYDEQSIMQAQRALGARGYDVGPVDGIWGPSSQAALRNFQQAKGMTVDERLGPETLAALGVSDAGGAQAQDQERDRAGATQAQAPQRRDNQQSSRDEERQGASLQQLTGPEAATSGTTTSGTTGNGASAAGTANGELEAFYDTRTVLEVQRALASRGFEVGRVDGVWGPESQSALRDFQQDQRLETSGRINERTLAALDVEPPGAGERREGTTR
ncbi:MAG TPA: peptidoglycan-binding domain-containing protein, partial [Myxococcota bacterium]|nr:peptidoglycan-binding domain-containing protein [Myxococcota bacterium]